MKEKINAKQILIILLSIAFCETSWAQETIVVDGVTFSADRKTLIKYSKDKTDEEYTVPEGTEIIGEKAIWDNDFLRVLTLPLTLKEIRDYAVAEPNITTIIWNTYPEFVGDCIWGFNDAHKSNLSSFLTTEKNDNCISADGVLFSKDKKKLLGFPPAKIKDRIEGKYEVPEGTEIIVKQAFFSADIAEIVLPSTLNRIEDEAFKITWLVCTGAGKYQRDLRRIFCNAITPPEIVGFPFWGLGDTDLYVPEESAETYRNTKYWKDFKSINGKRADSGILQMHQSTNLKCWTKDGVLYLESENTISEINIFNTNGTYLWKEDIHENKCQITTGKFPKGVFLLELITTDGRRIEIKFLN